MRLALNISPGELLGLESGICSNLAKFLDFKDHALYFPDEEAREAVWLPEERKLLAPVLLDGRFLGMMVLSEVRGRQMRRLLDVVPALISNCTLIEALKLRLRRDSLTAMSSEENFYASLENGLKEIRCRKDELGGKRQLEQEIHKLCIGMIILRWGDAEELRYSRGPDFGTEVFMRLAEKLASVLPENILVSPLGRFEGRHEFGLLVPASGTAACTARARAVLKSLEDFSVAYKLTGQAYRPLLYAGFALYPHDVRGEEALLPFSEQVRRLRDRARLAASFAVEAGGVAIPARVMGYREIPVRGGVVLECGGDGALRINLGLAANVDVGSRFDVYGLDDHGQEVKKGQLAVMFADADHSFAKMLFLSAAERPRRGDKLRLASSDSALSSFEDAGGMPMENVSDWLDYRSFQSSLTVDGAPFALAIVQAHPVGEEGDFEAKARRWAKESAELSPRPALRGRMGKDTLLFCHREVSQESVGGFYRDIIQLAADNGLKAQAGVFVWPFLDYSPGEAEICAQKALECARLLPEPQLAFFDSVALTVNADKLYSVGNIYEAIKEYEAAILADAHNVTALNSLGVALASLGKLDEARRCLVKALKNSVEPEVTARICYNLGAVYQQDDNLAAARTYYKRAVEARPDYAWAWLRLGQICAANGRKTEAGKMFEKAREAAAGSEGVVNAVNRQIARLKAARDQRDEARDILHDNLVANPGDLPSLLELARHYLSDDGDPAMAEMLAARALEMGGGRLARDVLAEAMEKQGKFEEAAAVRQTGI